MNDPRENSFYRWNPITKKWQYWFINAWINSLYSSLYSYDKKTGLAKLKFKRLVTILEYKATWCEDDFEFRYLDINKRIE